MVSKQTLEVTSNFANWLSLLLCACAIACSRPGAPRKRTTSPTPPTPSVDGAAPEDECVHADGCRESGACAHARYGCEPTQVEHCLRSEACHRDGRCRLLGATTSHYCGSETHADCASSPLCREHGRCLLAPADLSGNGPCINAKLREVQRLHLTEAVHGLSGDLVVLVDSRLKRMMLEDSNGYYPMDEDEELLASSLVQLRTTQGAVLSELTLYPAVNVTARKLGSGTDTFLATEHIACQAGRFCGWHTVFFEIRNERLLRLSAVGVGGQREVETTASFAARWMLTPAAKVGALEVVVQREDPERDPSVIVETRFSFSGGSWRFTERELARGGKASQQLGKWAGSLD